MSAPNETTAWCCHLWRPLTRYPKEGRVVALTTRMRCEKCGAGCERWEIANDRPDTTR